MDFKYGIELKLEYGTGKNVWNANTKSNKKTKLETSED